jgi:hypothetical protein
MGVRSGSHWWPQAALHYARRRAASWSIEIVELNLSGAGGGFPDVVKIAHTHRGTAQAAARPPVRPPTIPTITARPPTIAAQIRPPTIPAPVPALPMPELVPALPPIAAPGLALPPRLQIPVPARALQARRSPPLPAAPPPLPAAPALALLLRLPVAPGPPRSKLWPTGETATSRNVIFDVPADRSPATRDGRSNCRRSRLNSFFLMQWRPGGCPRTRKIHEFVATALSLSHHRRFSRHGQN